MAEAGIARTPPLSPTSRTWSDSMNNFIPFPALASDIDPPSYVTLYPLSLAKTVSGSATQRTITSNLFIADLLSFQKQLAIYVYLARCVTVNLDCASQSCRMP